MKVSQLAGYGLVALSATGFATLGLFGRAAYAGGLDTFTLLFLRFSLSALVMAGLVIARGEKLPARRDLAQLAGMGGIGYVGQSFCYLTAIKYASVGLVGLLLYLYPTFVALLSVVFLRRKLTRVHLLALGLATLGAMLTANPQGGSWTGILLALGGALIYSVYIVVGAGVMQRVSPVSSAMVIFASAGAVFGGLAALNGFHWPATPGGAWAVVGTILVATVVPVVAFLTGLKRVGPTDASMLSTLEPVVTVLLAAWLVGEKLQPVALLGGGLILTAVLLLTAFELRKA
jgi:drug/metabolite transporter (DMT)-like permease